LLPHATVVHQALLAAEQSVRDLSGKVSGRLRLATSHHIGLHRMPPVLSQYSKSCPSVQIDIEFMDSEQAHEQVARGQVELAIVTLAPGTDACIISRPLWPDPLDFLVARSHPFAREKRLSLELLATCPAILPGLNTFTGQIVKALFDKHGVDLQVSLATNYLETIRMLTSVGLGWTVLPRSMKDASLVTLKLNTIRIERTLGLVYHRDRSLSRAASAFIECLEVTADS